VTSAERLEQLWAVHAIEQLVYRYAFAFDTRDREAMLALWAPADGRVAFPDMNRATLEHFLDDFYAIGPSLLLVGNVIVELEDAEHATGVVYCWPQLELEGKLIDQAVVYRDAYVRHEGDWRFRTRRHILLHGQARERNPLAQPAANWPRSQVGRGLPLYPPKPAGTA
jgi:hypothetical protein